MTPKALAYEQIEKEFDEQFVKLSGPAGEPKEWISLTNEGDVKRLKSFLKQSFIKYLQSEVEFLDTKKNRFDEDTETLANTGYSIALDDISLRLQAQIKDFFKHRCYFYFEKSQIDEDYLINDDGVLEKQELKAYRYYKCKCGINYKTR